MSGFAGMRAPDLAEIEALAHDAFAALPLAFRTRCAGVTIHVEDFPDEQTLDEMNCESEFDILGLFRGVGLAQSGEVESGRMPNAVWLYRRPILDYWAEHDETLGDIVTHVLVHEIGHHFGLSDEDMDRIEAAASEV